MTTSQDPTVDPADLDIAAALSQMQPTRLTFGYEADAPAVTMPGEPTDVPGLRIVPDVSHTGEYTGTWVLVHARSGRRVGLSSRPLAYVREAAARMPRDVDWTADVETMFRAVPDLKLRIFEVDLAMFGAHVDGRPMWWARDSFEPHTVEDDDGTKTRFWLLYCAAPGCRTDAVRDDDGYIAASTRLSLIAFARFDGWIEHDDNHWVCPACTTAHPQDTAEGNY